MVGAFGSGAAAEAIAAAAAPLRARAGELAELDLVSYGGVLEALKRDKDDLERPAALAAALSAACDIPLETAQIASETCRLAARATDGANRWLTGDAIAAAQIALGACRAAAALVAVNLSDVTDDRPAQAAQYVAEAEVACQHAMSKTTKS